MIKINTSAKRFTAAFTWCALIFFAAYILKNSESATNAVYTALNICVKNVIPSLFPYMVLSALFLSSGLAQYAGRVLSKPFSKLFALNGNCSAAVIIGLLAGFPIGAKTAVSLYRENLCTKEEAERLCAFCNNTGPAFLIAGIGAGFFGNALIGVILYLIEILSAFLVGILFSIGKDRTQSCQRCTIRYRPDFTGAVKESVSAVLGVCGFVVFFSVLMEIISCILCDTGISFLLPVISCIIEVTAGASAAAQIGGSFGFVLAAFAVGWSGFCVHAQTASFLLSGGVDLKKYLSGKLFQGLLCTILALLVCLFF